MNFGMCVIGVPRALDRERGAAIGAANDSRQEYGLGFRIMQHHRGGYFLAEKSKHFPDRC